MWINAGVYLVSLIKLVLSPMIAIAILAMLKYVFCLDIGEEISLAMLIATAVSTAASAPSMAKKYGADSEYAATLTLGNTLLCVITSPFLYMLCVIIF